MTSYSLSTTLPSALKDIAIATWYALGMTGCEETASGDDVSIICYFKDKTAADTAKADLLSQFPEAHISIGEVADQDWNAQWKASMQPALVAPGVWASPHWLPPKAALSDCWIRIEPKMAFGTGHHATTRLAATAVQRISGRLALGYSLLDIGCGSGILCFMALHSGARCAIGVDIDPACAENLAENRVNNPTLPGARFAVGTPDMFTSSARFDCVVMNMILTESQGLLDFIACALRPGGLMLWSGILSEEKNKVIELASKKGFSIVEETNEEEWWCGVFSPGRL